LPVVGEEQNTSVSIAKPEHKTMSGGTIVGLVLVGLGLLLILIGLPDSKSGAGLPADGCFLAFYGLVIMAIGGVIILISSLVNN
jgi:hypothetical protein